MTNNIENEDYFKAHLESQKWDCILDEFVVFDTETTGLTPKSDRILEIGAILFRKDDYLRSGEITSFQCFIKQDNPISAEATAINGIIDDMVKDGDTEYAALTKFFEFVDGRKLYAYNAKFDTEFIRATARRCDFFDDKFRLEVEDVLPLVTEVFHDLPNRKLTTVAKHIGAINSGAHRAVNDCVMTLKILIHCRQALMIQASVAAREEILRLSRATAELQSQIDTNAKKRDANSTAVLIGVAFFILIFLFFTTIKN